MGKIKYDFTDEQILGAYEAANYDKAAAARELGMPRSSFCDRLGRIGADLVKEIEIKEVPPETDLATLLEYKEKKFERKRGYEEASKLRRCRVKIDGPIGILFHGDPHIDDDGCDIGALRRNSELTMTTEGLFAASVGDTTNNWVGRLARLYANQSTTANEAWLLSEWFVQNNKWLFLVAGNHDAWSGAGDPIKWICRERNAVYQSSEVRMELTFPQGDPVTINCRHDFQGHSMWNPAHGAGKAAQMGPMDDIFVNGHRHVNGYMMIKQPSGVISHCIQVASYKYFDDFAKERGFRDQTYAPAVVTIINPVADRATDKVTVFHDVERGVDYLKWLRSR